MTQSSTHASPPPFLWECSPVGKFYTPSASLAELNDPQLVWLGKLSRRYDDGLFRGDFAATTKKHFKLS